MMDLNPYNKDLSGLTISKQYSLLYDFSACFVSYRRSTDQ